MKAVGLAEFAADPPGKFVSGETYAHFCARPTLWGFIVFGRPTEDHAVELGRSLVLELDPPAIPHASIIDARHLDSGDPRAFLAADRYMKKHWVKLGAHVQKLAMLRPAGIGGAIVAGAYEVLPKPYPVGVFEEPAAACDWLGVDGAGAVSAMLDDVYLQASGTPAIVRALQAFLEANLGAPALAAAASSLRLSERSLQRKLGSAGTSFIDEVGAARVRAAKRMMLEGDAPMTAIALDVGCASLQHFSGLFRKHTGQSPTAFRAEMRAERRADRDAAATETRARSR